MAIAEPTQEIATAPYARANERSRAGIMERCIQLEAENEELRRALMETQAEYMRAVLEERERYEEMATAKDKRIRELDRTLVRLGEVVP